MKIKTWKSKALLTGVALAALLASPLARADYSSTVLSQGPVGYWRLNETAQPLNSTTAANLGSLGASGNGIYENFASGGAPGPFTGSTAVTVDGVSQRVRTPLVPGLNTTNFSFEVWACPAEKPRFGYIAGSGDMASPRAGWYLAQDDGSVFGAGSSYVVRFFNLNGTTESIQYAAPVTNAVGEWVHLVLTYNGSVGSLYMNGVLITNAPAAYVPGMIMPLTVGCRSSLANFWPGKAAEVAMYATALSPARVAAHYAAGTTAPGTYVATVQADSPVLYQRYSEAGSPPASNLGSLGAAANGAYLWDTTAGVSGPSAPPYAGFEAANKAASFSGAGGVVQIPALKLSTNTVTISGWVKASGSQPLGAGLVLHGSAANACGLTIDQINGGLGLGYIWNGNNYGISPSGDFGLPSLPDGQWAYAALVVSPLQAEIYICDANNSGNWASMTNSFNVNHLNQAFATATLIGAAPGVTTRNFNGAVDEVAIFKRALSAGELYTQYATAVGGVSPRIFNDLQGPTGDVAAGDPIVLTVDAGGTADLTFTWHKAGAGTIATTTKGELTIPVSTLTDSGTYDVTISNGAGSVDSQSLAVNVVTPSAPAISEIEGYRNRTLYKGATLRFAVVGTGGGLQYQWYKNASPIASATSSEYSVTVTDSTQAGSYSVNMTNLMGSATSGPPAVITIPTAASGSYEAAMIATAPEAWWRLDEAAGSTNLVDGMGRHDGYYTNVNSTTPPVALGAAGALVGNPNTAAAFSASGGVGVVPYSPLFSVNKFTIEGWAKTTVLDNTTLTCWSSTYDGTGESWRTGPNAGYWSPVSGANTYAPLFDNGQTNAVVVNNVWMHLVIIYDAAASADYPWKYYINGFRAGGYSWQGPAPNSGGPFIIGGRGVSATTLADYFWNGSVDEVAFYQRVLTDPEIQAHYTARGVEILPPSFSGPLLSQTVIAGKNITFSTSVFGTDPQLSWYKGPPLASAPIATGTSALSFNPAALADSGSYSLVASNSAGVATNTASLTVISPVAYANVTNDLVLHLKFEDDTTDSSGRGNSATVVNSPAFVGGKVGGKAFHFNTDTTNSIYNYATLGATTPADLKFGSSVNFSVAYWIRMPAGAVPGDLPVLCSATNSYGNPGITVAPSYTRGGWSWSLNGTGRYGADSSINDGNWHSVIHTFDRTSDGLTYLDGVLVNATGISSVGDVDQTGPMNIGQDPNGTYAESGQMDIDDLGVWRRVLTPLEVAQIASAGDAGRSFDTVAPASVTLTIIPSGSNLILNYASGTLYQSSDLGPSAVWTPVPGASAPSTTVTPTNAASFYRVLLQ